MAKLPEKPVTRHDVSARDDVSQFINKVKSMGAAAKAGARGRLIFAMDATMSRQPAWDQALNIQSEMFAETARIGGLDVQLVFFRGFNECKSSKWVSDPNQLARLMTKVDCRGGHTQIGKVLDHIKRENARHKIGAVVYVGDCMEEHVDTLCRKAGEIGLAGVKIFMFQEGHDIAAQAAFKEIARLTGGAWCQFSSRSAADLKSLLSAVAVYAAGGHAALVEYAGNDAQGKLLLEQLK